MGKRIIVFGAGASGLQIASELLVAGHEVILIDNNSKVVDAISGDKGFKFHYTADKEAKPTFRFHKGYNLKIFNSATLTDLPNCDLAINATTDFAKRDPKLLELAEQLDKKGKPIFDLANGLKAIGGIPKGKFDELKNVVYGVINFPTRFFDGKLNEVEAVNTLDKARGKPDETGGGFTFGSDADPKHIALLKEVFGKNNIKIDQEESKDTAQIVYDKYLQSFMVIPCALVGGNFGDCITEGTIQNQMTLALLKEIHEVATEKELEKRTFKDTYDGIFKVTDGKRGTRGSMQEHALAGKQLELDGFVKNLIELGKETGVKTPVMEAAYRLTQSLEKKGIKQKENEDNGIKRKPLDNFRRRITNLIENNVKAERRNANTQLSAVSTINSAISEYRQRA